MRSGLHGAARNASTAATTARMLALAASTSEPLPYEPVVFSSQKIERRNGESCAPLPYV